MEGGQYERKSVGIVSDEMLNQADEMQSKVEDVSPLPRISRGADGQKVLPRSERLLSRSDWPL